MVPGKRKLSVAHLLLLAALPFASASSLSAQSPVAAPAPQLSFGPQSASMSGVTPLGTVVWFGAGRQIVEYSAVILQTAVYSTADATGTASVPANVTIPRDSVWIGVDLKTGAYALGTPTGPPLHQFDFGATALNRPGGVGADHFLDPSDYVSVMIVRPGAGAWTKTLGKGGQGDDSPPEAPTMSLPLNALNGVVDGGPPPPDQLQLGDLVLALHPRRLEVAVQVIGGVK